MTPTTLKGYLNAALSRLPVCLWPVAGAVVRFVWPGFRTE